MRLINLCFLFKKNVQVATKKLNSTEKSSTRTMFARTTVHVILNDLAETEYTG